MQVVLAMFRSDGERRSFSLHKEVTIVGRREDCDLRIPLNEISRKHCRILREGEGLRIEDMGSSNGTYHNGQRVQEANVQAGDTIQVGTIAFVVQIDGTPADDALEPVLFEKPVRAAAAASDDSSVNEGSGNGEAPTQTESNSDSDAGSNDDGELKVDGDGDFDPMAFLEGGDSQISEGTSSAELDVEDSQHGQSAETSENAEM